MTVYALALLTIEDRARYERYAAGFARSLEGFDGRLLAADESPAVLEGSWQPGKVVLIGFSDRQEFGRWATSENYRSIAEDRIAAARSTVLLLDGIARATAPVG